MDQLEAGGRGVSAEHPATNPFKPGDRVIRKYDGRHGVVHAIYDDYEDNTEVKLNNGVYTCVHWTKFQKAAARKEDG